MAFKEFQLDAQTVVTVHKRRVSRNVRLSITPKGAVRVSIPMWAPYKMGVDFAKSRSDWIRAQAKPLRLLTNGQAVGKAHHLHFETADVIHPSSRTKGTQVLVRHPSSLEWHDTLVQAVAEKACIRALRAQAEQLLPVRLQTLADQHHFQYRSVRVKLLKSRWGSCDSRQNIALNLYLMQLPWSSIDYVLLHELTHTRIMRHGPDFWSAMTAVLPNVKEVRKQLRTYQPLISGAPESSMP